MSDFVMPSLGADMEAGKVVQWLVEAGSKVKSGDVVAVVETHKGAIEVEIFEAGEITELCVGLDEEVPVGTVLARVQKAGEATPAGAPEAAKPAEPVKPMEPAKAAEPKKEK